MRVPIDVMSTSCSRLNMDDNIPGPKKKIIIINNNLSTQCVKVFERVEIIYRHRFRISLWLWLASWSFRWRSTRIRTTDRHRTWRTGFVVSETDNLINCKHTRENDCYKNYVLSCKRIDVITRWKERIPHHR